MTSTANRSTNVYFVTTLQPSSIESGLRFIVPSKRIGNINIKAIIDGIIVSKLQLISRNSRLIRSVVGDVNTTFVLTYQSQRRSEATGIIGNPKQSLISVRQIVHAFLIYYSKSLATIVFHISQASKQGALVTRRFIQTKTQIDIITCLLYSAQKVSIVKFCAKL